jgi:phosphoglycolate phosphatase
MATLTISPAREILAVGFDVDGVIRDTGYDAYVAVSKALDELGGSVPSFEEYVHEYTTDVVTFYNNRGVHCTVERFFEVYKKYSNGHNDAAGPYDDVMEMLGYLQNCGLKAFAVSGHPNEYLQEWFRRHNIAQYFAHISGSSWNKVTCLTDACNNLDVVPAAACYVGDWGSDIRAACEAGLIPIGITRGYESRVPLLNNGALLVVDHFEDLRKVIV